METRHYELIALVVSNNANAEQRAHFDACFCADAEFRELFHLAEKWFGRLPSTTSSFDSLPAFKALKEKLKS